MRPTDAQHDAGLPGPLTRRSAIAAMLGSLAVGHRLARADSASPALARYQSDVDIAVDKGLAFLATNQQANPARNGSFVGDHGATNALASLAGMAYLAKGLRPGGPIYGQTINQCLDYVLSSDRTDGYLGYRGGRMYGQGIATLFLSEVSGMVDPPRQRRIDELLPRAVRLILDAQLIKKSANDQGGWRYEPTSTDSDLSVSGWNLMALRSARLNGAPVPAEAINNAVEYVFRCWKPAGGAHADPRLWWENAQLAADFNNAVRDKPGNGFGYGPFASEYKGRKIWVMNNPQPTLPMTGVGMLCLQLTGHRDHPTVAWSGDALLRHIDDPANATGFLNCPFHEYATYYCAQGMFQLGGEYWDRFADAMFRFLLPRQLHNGSWNNQPYATAMYLLAMAVIYRQLPVYQR